jgi:hypothetical protein
MAIKKLMQPSKLVIVHSHVSLPEDMFSKVKGADGQQE